MASPNASGHNTELSVHEDCAICESTLASTSLDLLSTLFDAMPKITQTDHFARLPNELIESILKRFEVQMLIPLRLVNPRWNVIIESMCHKEKSLALVSRHLFVKIQDRFYGQLDLSRLVTLKVKQIYPNFIESSVELYSLLGKLFPRVEQLFVDRMIFIAKADFISLFGLWSSSLVTLYFAGKIIIHQDSFSLSQLCSILNGMTNLKNFHFPDESNLPLVSLVPTLQRLHSFSFGLFNSHPQVTCDELVNHLGPHCTSLIVSVLSQHYSLFDCLTWPIRIAQSPVTHLHLNAFDSHDHLENFIFRVFPEHFAATLASLRFTNWQTYPKLNLSSSTINPAMSRLTQLTDIRIDGATKFHLSEFCLRDAIPMPNIRSFSLYNFWLYCSAHNSEELFCQFFSTIYPNLERLTLHCRDRGFSESIRPFLNLFKALRYHDISYIESYSIFPFK